MTLALRARILFSASAARVQAEGTALAIVLWAAIDGRTRLAGVLIAVTTFPQLVTGPMMGRVLDRTQNPERVIAIAAAGAAFGCFLLAWSGLRLVPAVAGALVLAWTTPVLTGGLSSVMMGWDGEADTIAAWDSTGYNVAGLAAPLIVTVVAVRRPAIAFVVLGVFALLVVVPLGRRRSRRDGVVGERANARIRDAVVAIIGSRRLLAVTVATTLSSLGLGGFEIALVAAVRRRGIPVERVGVLVTALAIGALVGSLAMTRVRRPIEPAAMVLASVGLSGALVLAIAAGPWTAMLVSAVAVGLVDAPLLVGTYRTRSSSAPPTLRSGVFTVAASCKLGAASIGALAVTSLVGDGATDIGLVAIGITGLAASGLGVWILRRRPSPEPRFSG